MKLFLLCVWIIVGVSFTACAQKAPVNDGSYERSNKLSSEALRELDKE